MKSFDKHSWLEFWFYGVHPGIMMALTCIGVMATLEMYPFRLKTNSRPCEKCKRRENKDSLEQSSTSATFTMRDARPADNDDKLFEAEPINYRHPSFRYSFIPTSPFGAAMPIRVSSSRTPSSYHADGTHVRVRSLQNFLLPPLFSRHRFSGEQYSDGTQTPDKARSRRMSAVPENMRGVMMV
ncbi:hypothetical protein BKA58DRAFT_387495 [Alternaria rosae]|uniref:uncharacterized protein n=1 Tax=Alternaria rosae TaxID=1187941 RepID=UPI001E8E5AE7|nr:uncharacterized protein BKA58DRAFT_387495 [Alternaria rosae]KAH6868730.1 hypothetical protein BKA58DRAFT_387495 [Alternaria rosae]